MISDIIIQKLCNLIDFLVCHSKNNQKIMRFITQDQLSGHLPTYGAPLLGWRNLQYEKLKYFQSLNYPSYFLSKFRFWSLFCPKKLTSDAVVVLKSGFKKPEKQLTSDSPKRIVATVYVQYILQLLSVQVNESDVILGTTCQIQLCNQNRSKSPGLPQSIYLIQINREDHGEI